MVEQISLLVASGSRRKRCVSSRGDGVGTRDGVRLCSLEGQSVGSLLLSWKFLLSGILTQFYKVPDCSL